ncbi:uncharacterized protein LOC132744582 [Ruditapes philippinarum]|uniref:uncharacterized protein LOC132744582 n=1 Tax=Ruditapes philippinarum TaxID=129788 RepID=UPI00295BC316|nr:uncharacterized protein LOC132744582 [Ruditapes philippinarum]
MAGTLRLVPFKGECGKDTDFLRRFDQYEFVYRKGENYNADALSRYTHETETSKRSGETDTGYEGLYIGHRAFMKLQGREDESEKLNRDALTIARRVADKYGKLIAGGLSDTPLYSKDDKESHQTIYEIFKVTSFSSRDINILTLKIVPISRASEGGVDYIIGESFDSYGEAQLALRAIKEYGKGCLAVITMAAHIPDYTTDGLVRFFKKKCHQYIGLCCGNYPSLIREVAEVYGKKPPASKYAWISGEVPKTERGKKIRRFMVGE